MKTTLAFLFSLISLIASAQVISVPTGSTAPAAVNNLTGYSQVVQALRNNGANPAPVLESVGVNAYTGTGIQQPGSGHQHFVSITVPAGVTVLNGVVAVIRTPGSYTADAANFNGAALYAPTSGTATLVGQSANLGEIWKTSGIYAQIPFSSPVTVTPGRTYYVMLQWTATGTVTTTPGFASAGAGTSNSGAMLKYPGAPFLNFLVFGPTVRSSFDLSDTNIVKQTDFKIYLLAY